MVHSTTRNAPYIHPSPDLILELWRTFPNDVSRARSDEPTCIRTAVSSNYKTGSMSERIIPTHLKKLYDDPIQGKTEKEKQSIANLLIKY